MLGYVNAGVSGDTTRLGLERFPRDVQESGADTVLIQFGHNDANCWKTDRGLPRVSNTAFGANLVEMIDRARAFGIKPVLLGMTRPARDPAYVEKCWQYNRSIVIRTTVHDVPYHDMWPHFWARYFLDDGLHLNEEGHGLYAEHGRRFLA